MSADVMNIILYGQYLLHLRTTYDNYSQSQLSYVMGEKIFNKSMNAQKHLGIAALILTAFVAPLSAQIFEHTYTGDYLPNDPQTQPTWDQIFSGPNSTASVSGGVLTIDAATDSGGLRAYRTVPAGWNGSASLGNTIEFVLKVDSQAPGRTWSQSIALNTGAYGATITLSLTAITNGEISGNSATYALNTTSFHTYRFTTSDVGLLSLYVDNNPTAAFAVQMEVVDPAANYVDFGTTTSYGGGTVQWDSISWTNAGAFAPVPEPASVVLLGLAGLLVIPIRRHLMRKSALA